VHSDVIYFKLQGMLYICNIRAFSIAARAPFCSTNTSTFSQLFEALILASQHLLKWPRSLGRTAVGTAAPWPLLRQIEHTGWKPEPYTLTLNPSTHHEFKA
jgi:hypothetical protein